MSGESAFEKRYVDPKDRNKLEELLEMFNLPPRAIAFLKTYKRPVQIVLAVVLVVVVSGSLYSSYRERQIEDGASALALALKETGNSQKEALESVAAKYGSTPSALWARIELAHLLMTERKFADAAAAYGAIHGEVKSGNPVYALSLYGMAQAEEAAGNIDGAMARYEELTRVEGYMMLGYTGMGRLYEAKGELEQALGLYGQYLAVLGDNPENSGDRMRIESQIARLKARQ